MKSIFDRKLIERERRMRGNCALDPLSLLIFIKASEFTLIKGDFVLPSRFNLQKMFESRDRFTWAIVSLLKDIFFQKHISDGHLEDCIEDLFYLLNRIEEIQLKLDEIILNLKDEDLCNKYEVLRTYKSLIQGLIDFLSLKVDQY